MAIFFHTNNTLLATDLNENKGPTLEAALAKVKSFTSGATSAVAAAFMLRRRQRGRQKQIYGQTRVSQATKPAASLHARFWKYPKIKNNTHCQIIQSKCLGAPHIPSCLYRSNCSDLTFLLHIHDVVFRTTIHLRRGLGQPRAVACFCMLRILEEVYMMWPGLCFAVFLWARAA